MKYFTFVDFINVENWIIKINDLKDSEWKDYEYRQKNFRSHKETETIPLLWNEDLNASPLKYKHYDTFEKEIDNLNKFFLDKYSLGEITRCIIVKLLPKKIIPYHTDTALSFITSKRHHIPLITNLDVSFKILEESLNMKTGEVWEINNTMPHMVENNSDTDRIHIIVDWKSEA